MSFPSFNLLAQSILSGLFIGSLLTRPEIQKAYLGLEVQE